MSPSHKYLLCLLLFASATSAFAQQPDCGPAPGGAAYSDQFLLGVYKMVENDSGTSASAYVPEIGFGSYDSSSHEKEIDDTSIQQARSYVQQESKFKGAAIVAQCRYGFCTLPQTKDSDLAIKALGDVCETALLGSVPSSWALSPPSFRIAPDLYPVVFDDQTTLQVNATITNDGEAVRLRIPMSEAHVSVLKPKTSGEIKIPAHSTAQLTFLLKKPTQARTDETLSFYPSDNTTATTIEFRLIASSQYFQPPADISSGTIDPQMTYKINQDTGVSESGSTGTSSIFGLSSTPVSRTYGNCYLSNGKGCGEPSVQASFVDITPGDSKTTYSQLNVTTTIFTQSGCCGGKQPGGSATARPQWASTTFLPGLHSDHWTFKVTPVTQLTTEPANLPQGHIQGPCTFSIDGQGKDVPDDWTTPNPTSAIFTLSPGTHFLTYECPAFGTSMDNFGAGSVRPWHLTVKQSLLLHATKVDSNSP